MLRIALDQRLKRLGRQPATGRCGSTDRPVDRGSGRRCRRPGRGSTRRSGPTTARPTTRRVLDWSRIACTWRRFLAMRCSRSRRSERRAAARPAATRSPGGNRQAAEEVPPVRFRCRRCRPAAGSQRRRREREAVLQQPARLGRRLGQRAAQAGRELGGVKLDRAPRAGRHRRVDLLHPPRLQARLGNLIGKRVGVGRLADRLQHGLMHQRHQRIVVFAPGVVRSRSPRAARVRICRTTRACNSSMPWPSLTRSHASTICREPMRRPGLAQGELPRHARPRIRPRGPPPRAAGRPAGRRRGGRSRRRGGRAPRRPCRYPSLPDSGRSIPAARRPARRRGQQRGPRAAGPLRLPGPPAVGGGQDRAQFAGGPAVLVVDEGDRPQAARSSRCRKRSRCGRRRPCGRRACRASRRSSSSARGPPGRRSRNAGRPSASSGGGLRDAAPDEADVVAPSRLRPPASRRPAKAVSPGRSSAARRRPCGPLRARRRGPGPTSRCGRPRVRCEDRGNRPPANPPGCRRAAAASFARRRRSANTPLGYMAERQPMAQPCRGSKKPIRRKAGSKSLGLCVQVLSAVAGAQDARRCWCACRDA